MPHKRCGSGAVINGKTAAHTAATSQPPHHIYH